MTHFEYLAIAFSLVFSFTALRIVGGLPYAVRSDRRYWVHVVFLVALLLNMAGSFWAFWSYRDVAWTFPKFLLALLSPGFIYYLAATVVPNEPESVGSWREFYYSIRQRAFIGLGCWGLVTVATATFLVDLPWMHPARLGELATLALAVVGAASTSPRVHAGLALSALAAVAAFGLAILFEPGSLR